MARDNFTASEVPNSSNPRKRGLKENIGEMRERNRKQATKGENMGEKGSESCR